LTFATAALVGAAFGRYAGKQTGETALLRQLFEQLRVGDLVVADRYHCSYFMIALLQQRGVDVAFRLHQLRQYDFDRGRRLGHDDHVVEWERPTCPAWMDAATYATMPATLTVREVRFAIDQPGYRTRTILVATTLLDERVYRREDIADLYHQRWQAELDLRSIKQTLGMATLVCKTPAMAAKELWAHLLGYNLARKVAAQAAWLAGLRPRQLSFAGVVQTLETFANLLLAVEPTNRRRVYRCLFRAIAAHRVGQRPGRVEPRRLKRRSDKYPMLHQPRGQARAELLHEQPKTAAKPA
jgi:Transposase DDE domain